MQISNTTASRLWLMQSTYTVPSAAHSDGARAALAVVLMAGGSRTYRWQRCFYIPFFCVRFVPASRYMRTIFFGGSTRCTMHIPTHIALCSFICCLVRSIMNVYHVNLHVTGALLFSDCELYYTRAVCGCRAVLSHSLSFLHLLRSAQNLFIEFCRWMVPQCIFFISFYLFGCPRLSLCVYRVGTANRSNRQQQKAIP